MPITTGFIANGVDIGAPLVEKSYLIDRYPELADTFRFAGLWSWGYNAYGSSGDNTVVNKSSPVQTISAGTNWTGLGGNGYGIAAIKTDGTLWVWGNNSYGQLGDNSTIKKSSPIQTISGGTNWKSVSAGTGPINAAIKTDGTLWVWGQGSFGSIGNNIASSVSSPVQTVAAGTNWKQVSVGPHRCAAIKTDGTLWTWGYNINGQLGDNTVMNKSSPVQTVAAGTNWKQVSSGTTGASAIKTDGTLWSWGQGTSGQLGDNNYFDVSSPVQTISGGTNWKQVSAGRATTAAIKTDGTLWSWGRNDYGQCADNTAIYKSSPVQTVSGGTNWKTVSLGWSVSAIKTDGTLWMWGLNNGGSLGAGFGNTGVNTSSPIQTISAGTNWKQSFSGSYAFTAAIRDDSSDIFGNSM